MADALQLLKLNRKLDVSELRRRFEADGRVQVRDVLEDEAARHLAGMLTEKTPWGLTWQAGDDGPHFVKADRIPSMGPQYMQEVSGKLNRAMSGTDFAFIFSHYSATDGLVKGTSAGSVHDQLAQELNHPEILEFIRQVTGVAEIGSSDAQVTHFGRGQFLSAHEDNDAFEGDNRLVAYVLNLTYTGWRPDWGGYLNFFDADGDLIHGWAPRFNCLNMFKVPQWHNVSMVTPSCAGHRLAVGGWFRAAKPD